MQSTALQVAPGHPKFSRMSLVTGNATSPSACPPPYTPSTSPFRIDPLGRCAVGKAQDFWKWLPPFRNVVGSGYGMRRFKHSLSLGFVLGKYAATSDSSSHGRRCEWCVSKTPALAALFPSPIVQDQILSIAGRTRTLFSRCGNVSTATEGS